MRWLDKDGYPLIWSDSILDEIYYIAAFCLLANIPDFWRRTQTIRMTELFISLNMETCSSGRTTRARFCALVNVSPSTFFAAVKKVQDTNVVKKRETNRLALTIEQMKKYRIELIRNKNTDLPRIKALKDQIRTSLQNHSEAYGFTDGSSKPREKKPNSGIGIVLFDSNKQPIWEGGESIRTDGNNYVAEVAAASILLSSVPQHTKLTLLSDCQAAIFTLLGQPAPEKKLLRTPARAWTSLGQGALRNRKDIKILHVRSHQGVNTFEQRGNDKADQIAKHFLSISETQQPLPFYMKGDTRIELSHQGKLINQDVRKF